MTKKIWKIKLEVTKDQEITVRKNAEFLCVQAQNEIPCIWVLVDPNKKEEIPVRIKIFGTGHEIGEKELDGFVYIGTFQLSKGAFVFHVFGEDVKI